ncbi:hypothetical protein [Endozoicomonas sp. Mp262]|uniref:hypothetical protein n=1 Tax=Endozoicomonas sp. Mp262 TaxID=2919499 RepID=UPI0021D9AF01
MLINAEEAFRKTQEFIILLVAHHLSLHPSRIRITRLTNHPEHCLIIEGEYKKHRSKKWKPFEPLIRADENHPIYKNSQKK